MGLEQSINTDFLRPYMFFQLGNLVGSWVFSLAPAIIYIPEIMQIGVGSEEGFLTAYHFLDLMWATELEKHCLQFSTHKEITAFLVSSLTEFQKKKPLYFYHNLLLAYN